MIPTYAIVYIIFLNLFGTFELRHIDFDFKGGSKDMCGNNVNNYSSKLNECLVKCLDKCPDSLECSINCDKICCKQKRQNDDLNKIREFPSKLFKS